MNKGPEYQLQTQHLAHPLHSSPTARGLTVFIYRAEAKRRGRQQGAQQDSNPASFSGSRTAWEPLSHRGLSDGGLAGGKC